MAYLRFLRENAHFLLAGFLLAFTSSYGQTFFIAVFSAEIMAAFDLTFGGWGFTYTVGTTMSALVMVWAGGLTDTFRVRILAPFVFLGLAAACFAMSQATSVVALTFVILALRFFGQGMSSHLNIVSMSRWFVVSRGRALAIAAMGFALGQAMLPWGFVQLKAFADWRSLWMVAGGMAFVTIFPLLYLLRFERTPQSVAADNPVAGLDGKHWTRGTMLRHPLFWLLLPVVFGPSAWNTSLFFWQVHLAEVKGWAHADFVAIIPFFTLVAIVATFVSGWAVDRFGSGRPYVLLMLPQIVGFALIPLSDSLSVAWIAMGFLAISAGSFATVPGAFVAEYFGTRFIGSIKALITAVMVLGSAVGPGITGFMINHGFDFPDQMMAIAAYFVAASFALWLGVERYRPRVASVADAIKAAR